LEVLATEWEWENDPEISVVHAVTLEEAVVLFNTYSPRFILSLLTTNEQEHSFVWAHARAPFIGNGMTRWVDGQYALHRPELGLANWELGAQIGRGAILSGGDVFSVRYRAEQSDSHLHR
jgi:glutamate-5-semialdehyde dehydrogenase